MVFWWFWGYSIITLNWFSAPRPLLSMVFRWFSYFLGQWLTMVLKFLKPRDLLLGNVLQQGRFQGKDFQMISPLPLQLKLSRCWAQKLCTSRFWVQLWSDCGVEGSPGTSMLQHQLWQFPHHSEITSILMPGQHSTAQQYVFSKRLVSTTLSEEQIGFIDFCCKESCLLKAL